MKILATSYCPTSLEGNGGGPDGGPAPISPGSLVLSSLGLSGMTGPEHPFYRCLPAPGSGSIGPRH
jgi:hypothetical protein